MKVIATVTAANSQDRWAASFPVVDADKCFPILNGKCTAQPDECFRELAASDMVQGVDFREPFLNHVVALWVRLVNGWKNDNCIAKTADGISQTMKRITRRAETGHSTHVRAIWHQRGANAASLSIVTDGHGGEIVETREYERLFAWKMAEAAKIVSEDLAERGLQPIQFDAQTAALLDELSEWRKARETERETKAANERRFLCDRYRNGACSPCKFDCPHFKGGMCVEIAAA